MNEPKTAYPLAWPSGDANYREVVGFPGYAVGDDGSIWSRIGRGKRAGQLDAEWRLMTAHIRSKGRNRLPYMKVGLVKDKKLYHPSVHTIVLCAFIGPCPDGMQALHGDDDPMNNNLTNLEWGTPKANSEQRAISGRQVRGIRVTGAKLTEKQVLLVRERFAAGETQSALARELGVTQHSVWAIVRGVTWKHLNRAWSDAQRELGA